MARLDKVVLVAAMGFAAAMGIGAALGIAATAIVSETTGHADDARGRLARVEVGGAGRSHAARSGYGKADGGPGRPTGGAPR